jgi:hypothetical protein
LFQEQERQLCFQTTAAKIAAVTNFGVSKDILEMFTLFGDPGQLLRLESKHNYPYMDIMSKKYCPKNGQIK